MAVEEVQPLEQFLAEVERAALDFPGSAGVPIIRPKKHEVLPYLWRGPEIERLLRQSERVALGERRMLRLANPGTPGWKYVTQTMSVSIQQIQPGELAVPHRHAANAIRFCLKGSGAYTTVEGDKCVMEPGDLIVTPGWDWHDYGAEGEAAGVWLDALDLSLAQYLDVNGYLSGLGEELGYDKSNEQRLTVEAAGISEQRFAAVGLKPISEPSGTSQRAGLIHYRWPATIAALRRLAKLEADPYDDVALDYVNPATGGSLFPTIGCRIQMIRPGVRTRAHRHTSSSVHYVVEGEGETVIGSKRFRWGPGDLFVTPVGYWHEHASHGDEPALLFSVHDEPAMKALGFYYAEPHPERQVPAPD